MIELRIKSWYSTKLRRVCQRMRLCTTDLGVTGSACGLMAKQLRLAKTGDGWRWWSQGEGNLVKIKMKMMMMMMMMMMMKSHLPAANYDIYKLETTQRKYPSHFSSLPIVLNKFDPSTGWSWLSGPVSGPAFFGPWFHGAVVWGLPVLLGPSELGFI